MSISYRDGDIFEQRDIDAIAHQTNTYGRFGAGIAKRIAELYPAAYEKSKTTCAKFQDEPDQCLGLYDVVPVLNENSDRDFFWIFNIYSQEGMGGDDRNTRYDPLVSILEKIRARLEKAYKSEAVFKLGIPHGFGCGLAKGSWIIVEAIFRSVFEDSKNVEIVVVKNPKFADSVKK